MMLGLIQQGLDPRLSKAPSTGIQRFFLRPDYGAGVRVGVKIVPELGPWEGVQLLDAGDGGVIELSVCSAVFVESGVDLSCA